MSALRAGCIPALAGNACPEDTLPEVSTPSWFDGRTLRVLLIVRALETPVFSAKHVSCCWSLDAGS